MDDYPYDLGPVHRPVTCAGPEAQRWFDRGLAWTYGFHHEEAMRCFGRALEADPDCAMAHWGLSYAIGPNYNYHWEHMDLPTRGEVLEKARASAEAARAAADRAGATEAERALIDALFVRCPQVAPQEDQSPWDTAFADAMRAAHRRFPDDLDVVAIFAESILTRTPWRMWDLATGEPAEGAWTLEAREVLERAMRELPGAMDHAGILHIHVHLMEMSPIPEVALPAADRLRTLVPDAGHLVHMPTHIDVLCGAYADVVAWNEAAVRADRKWYDRNGGMDFYTGYRQHDYHFVIYGAMFAGRHDPALRAADELIATTPPELLRVETPPMADFFESYLSFRPHVFVRFGRWREAIAEPLPEDPELFCTVTAMTLYARGVAHAALGEVAEAEAAQVAFRAARARVPESRLLHNNTVQDLLGIAEEMLQGEIDYRKGLHDKAFAHLRAAVAAEDALPYDEPWGWMQPSRHALGALLLEQGRAEEAEAVYREDLGLGGRLSRAQVHPDNVWALRGLWSCLEARDATGTAEARLLRQRLDIALARADGPVAVSCMCANGVQAA